MITNQWLEKVEQRDLRVGVIGLGYVGLPLAVSFAKAGLSVIGFDVDTHKVTVLNEGARTFQMCLGMKLPPSERAVI